MRGLCLVLVLTGFFLSGCVATKRSGFAATGRALARPDVWVPAVAGGVILAGGWDREISDRFAGSAQGPLEDNINDREVYGKASDVLLYSSPALWITPTAFNAGCCNPPYPNCGCTRATTGRRMWTGVGATAATAGIGQLWKHGRGRKRPDDPGDTDSFPSGHTYLTSVAATLSRHEIGRSSMSPSQKRWASAGVTLVPIATAILRVRAKRHYPSDVLVGYAYGSFMGHLTNEVWLSPSDALMPTITSSRMGNARRFNLGFTMDL